MPLHPQEVVLVEIVEGKAIPNRTYTDLFLQAVIARDEGKKDALQHQVVQQMEAAL